MTVKYILWCVVFLTLFKSGLNKSPFDIFIGGIFDVDQDEQELAFKHAIQIINEEKFLFPNNLVSLTERVRKDNEFQVAKTVCSMLSKGVYGIFGPSSKSSSDHVQSICDTKEIPHVEMMWNNNQQRVSCLVNVYPHLQTLSYVFVDLIKELKWKRFTVLYENDDSLKRISEVIKMSTMKEYFVAFKQLDVTYTTNYRPALIDVKKSGETYFLLDCSIQILEDVLRQAMQVGLMSDYHHYIITNLDLHTIDLYPFQHGGANITGVQLVNPYNTRVKKVSNSLYFKKQLVRPTQIQIPYPEIKFRIETALIYDAVRLFSEAIQELSISKHLESKILYCNDTSSWEHGYSIINFMRTQNCGKGLTGNVKLDNQGFRSDFLLNINELTTRGLQNIGKWNSTQGLSISRPVFDYTGLHSDENSLHNRSFRVLIALSEPYNMLKKTSNKLIGNDRFEGYGIDLIHELSLMLGFNYTFKLQEDGNYGTKNLTTGEWNGMIRELLDENADLAITDLTITSEREEAVDFTSPFMNLGISILYKKPMKLPPSLFSFMSPFSEQVWYYLGGAYVGVSLTLYLLARLSPAEWTNRYPCIDEPQFLENQFSFRNCFWFTLGSLMQQGSELAPVAISTRMVAGTWWFFTLIMVSSYTANLAAFLTVESLSSPFKTIEELANQNVIKFGAKRDGATSNFFRNSTYLTYKKIWKFMETYPEVMTESNPEGVKRAETENYAFFMESTTIEYSTERHCNLTQIGRLLDDKGYGIAMRKNMSYRHPLSTAVLKLQETGRLRDLKRKWWKEKRGGGLCTADEVSGDKSELGLENVGGVFFVLVVGSASGLLVGIAEMMMDTLNTSWQRKTSFRRELEEELAFLFQLKNKTKKVQMMRGRAASKDFSDFKFQDSMIQQ